MHFITMGIARINQVKSVESILQIIFGSHNITIAKNIALPIVLGRGHFSRNLKTGPEMKITRWNIYRRLDDIRIDGTRFVLFVVALIVPTIVLYNLFVHVLIQMTCIILSSEFILGGQEYLPHRHEFPTNGFLHVRVEFILGIDQFGSVRDEESNDFLVHLEDEGERCYFYEFLVVGFGVVGSEESFAGWIVDEGEVDGVGELGDGFCVGWLSVSEEKSLLRCSHICVA